MGYHPNLTLFSCLERVESSSNDVKTAFLNGDLKENVFMSQPKGFVVKAKEKKVCKRVKSLYGLKQAPRSWYEQLTEHILKLNFEHFDLDDATLL